MGWKTIPGTGGWEVYDKLTWNGRHRFRYAENGNPTRTGFVPREKLIARLGSFFDLTRNGIDQRIETTDNGEITLRVAVEESDFKLFCTPIDSSTFKAIKLHWDRGRWRELEEQKLMEKCLDELYELGELTLQTGDELAEYEEFLKLKDPGLMTSSHKRFDQFFVVAHTYFVNFGLKSRIYLLDKEIMSLQVRLKLKPTGRYGLATARAVKKLQQKLKAEGLYTDGSIDGIFNAKFETAWNTYKESQGHYGVFIAELEITIDPDKVLSQTLISRLREVAIVLVGIQEYEKYRKRNPGGWIIRVGKTETGETVYLVLGDKFSEEVAWAIRMAAMLLQEGKESTNAMKEMSSELERRGLTPENLEQMARDIEWAIDIAGWILLFYGGIKYVGKEAAERAVRKLKQETKEELYKKLARKKAKGEFVDELAEEVVKRKKWEKDLAREAARTAKGKVRRWVRHHLFPKEFRKYFKGKIDIEKWVRKVDEKFHGVMHGKRGRAIDSWNGRWRKFFKPYDGRPDTEWPTARQMENFMKKLCKEFGILLE